jgi:hypothetical protein
MRFARLLIIVFAVLLVSIGCSFAGGAGGEPTLAEILMLKAAEKDVRGLTALRDRAMVSPDSRYVFYLALYIAAPKDNAATFVQNFPTSSEAVMGYIYTLELAQSRNGARLTPSFLYSFSELGKLAFEGNPEAVQKMYLITAHSDGVVKEFVCENVTHIIANDPITALNELYKLSLSQRQEVYSCFGTASMSEIGGIRKALEETFRDRNGLAKEMLEELEKATRY